MKGIYHFSGDNLLKNRITLVTICMEMVVNSLIIIKMTITKSKEISHSLSKREDRVVMMIKSMYLYQSQRIINASYLIMKIKIVNYYRIN